jgi:dihydrofolate reductase
MGELHVNMISTLDGVMQANGGPTPYDEGFEYAGWERPFWSTESGDQVVADVQASDALLLGRTTYDIFRSYWPGQEDEIAQTFNHVPKYVASRGSPELSWDISTHLSEVATEVREVRERHTQVHTWGSADLLQTLFREALVDQVNLWVCPVVLGTGKRVWPEGTAATRFDLAEPARSYDRGLVLMRLRRLDGPPETEEPVED